MMKLPKERQRELVLGTLIKHGGNVDAAAVELRKSARTVRRYMRDLKLYDDMDRLGLIQKAGPPRGHAPGEFSVRRARIIPYIERTNGDIDYGELTVEVYGSDTPTLRNRIYSALAEMRAAGYIASDGQKYWILRRP